ncbi:MAG TPA: hypothetical protein VFD49_14690 [Candidatus Dormibacteraeota bacterium]|nr:hypothetical protein [Candidatus Dormibacteraeota bacterium]
MAHWATYVLVDRSGHEVRAHRWGAADLEILLAAGPEAALAVMRAGELQSEEAVDDGLTEAGVLVDLSERLLLLAHCHRLVEMDLRRAYFLLLGEAWPGWRLRWAYGGMGELADRVGAPRAPLPPPPLPTACRPAADPGQAGVMVTVQRPDGALLLHPLERDVFDLVWLGPGLLDLLPPAETALRLSRHPYLGIHLETGAGSLGLWTTWELASPPGALAERWPGWKVDFWEDRFEEQATRCRPALALPDLDPVAALDRLATALLPDPAAPTSSPLVDRVARNLSLARSRAADRSAGDGRLR